MIAAGAVLVGLILLVWSADRFVAGAAATAWHFQVPPEVLGRDVATMAGLAALLCVMGYRRQGPGRINRLEGGVLLLCFGAYTAWVLATSI